MAGLARIRTGYTTAALSNGGFALLTRLVKSAALPFDCVLSAELAHPHKPDAAVYRTPAAPLGGARAAGLRTAFVNRPQEKGPHRQADRAEDVECDLHATSFFDLANPLDTP